MICSILVVVILVFPNAVRAELTILILGDSLTAGYGVEQNEAFPWLLNQKLQQLGYSDVNVINGGFSGSTSASAIQRLRWHMKRKPDILVLELGANDGLRGQPIEVIRSNLAKTIQLALENHIETVLAGMKLPVNYGNHYTNQFETLFVSLANEYHLSLIPFLLEGVAAKPELNLADGIHPNPQGHKIVAETVLKTILPLVKKHENPGNTLEP